MHDVATCIACAAESALPLEELDVLHAALAQASEGKPAGSSSVAPSDHNIIKKASESKTITSQSMSMYFSCENVVEIDCWRSYRFV